MPQMAPLNWTFMFFIFTLITSMILNKMFFMNSNPLFNSYNNPSLYSLTNLWKW